MDKHYSCVREIKEIFKGKSIVIKYTDGRHDKSYVYLDHDEVYLYVENDRNEVTIINNNIVELFYLQ